MNSREFLPECCRKCLRLDSDSKDEYSPLFYFCTIGVAFPIKKGECKRMRSKSLTGN